MNKIPARIVTIVQDRDEPSAKKDGTMVLEAGYVETYSKFGDVIRRFYNDDDNAVKNPKLGEEGYVAKEPKADGYMWFFRREA